MEDNIKKFPLFNLPFVALKKVMYQMELFSVLKLTSVSKQTKQAVSFCKLNATDVELQLTKNFSSFLNVVYQGEKYSWGVIKTVNADSQGKLINPINQKLFKPICTQVLSILHKKSVDTFRFDRPIEFFDIDEHWGILQGVTDIYVGSDDVSHQELLLILGRFGKLKNLFIDPMIPMWFNGFESGLKLDTLYLEAVNSMSLMNLQAKVLLMKHSVMGPSDLNVFLKDWMAHKTNPTVIRIFKVNTSLEILEGIKRHPWNPKQRSQFYVVQLKNGTMAIDCSDGYDIYREDGTMATVIFKNNTFDFLVWGERFQKVPESAVKS